MNFTMFFAVTNIMLIDFAILQATNEAFPWWATLGVGGVCAGVTMYYARLDRKSSDERYQAAEKRWESITSDFKSIVQENTKALTSLQTTISTAHCPMATNPASIVAVTKPRIAG